MFMQNITKSILPGKNRPIALHNIKKDETSEGNMAFFFASVFSFEKFPRGNFALTLHK